MHDEETGTVGWLVHGSRRQRRRSGLIRYLALFVTILFGVAGGILLANWVTANVAQAPGGSFAEKAGHVASKIGSELNTVYKQATAKVKGQEGTREERLRASRASSETGRNLAHQCEDWRRAYEQGHSQTARAEMDKQCRRYETFLETGIPSPR